MLWGLDSHVIERFAGAGVGAEKVAFGAIPLDSTTPIRPPRWSMYLDSFTGQR